MASTGNGYILYKIISIFDCYGCKKLIKTELSSNISLAVYNIFFINKSYKLFVETYNDIVDKIYYNLSKYTIHYKNTKRRGKEL